MTDLSWLLQLSSVSACVHLFKGLQSTWNTELRAPANVKEGPDGEQLLLMMPQVSLPFQRGKELKDCYQLLLLGAADKVFFQSIFLVLPWIWLGCKNQAEHLSQHFPCSCESQHTAFITGWENTHCWFLVQKFLCQSLSRDKFPWYQWARLNQHMQITAWVRGNYPKWRIVGCREHIEYFCPKAAFPHCGQPHFGVAPVQVAKTVVSFQHN